MAQAVKIISMPKTRSTFSIEFSSFPLGFSRLSKTPPTSATAKPTPTDSASALAKFEPKPKSALRPTCLSPLVKVTMEIMKPTSHI